MERKGNRSFNVVLFSVSVILAIFVSGIFGYFIFRESSKKKQVEKEIENLKEQAERVKRENGDLEEKIAYLKTEEYREVQAKEKLNLQSPGENLIVVSEGPVKKTMEDDSSAVILERAPSLEIPNYQKWLNYFFN